MFTILAASMESTPPAPPGIQGELMRRFGFDPVVASLLVVLASTLGSLLARWLWTWAVYLWENYRYGGWVIRVSGGKSRRSWHMPLDIGIVKGLQTGQYVAFKRDLGSILSGEGTLDFSLGVEQSQPLRAAPPQAPGLQIDEQRRAIEVVFLTNSFTESSLSASSPGSGSRVGNTSSSGVQA